MYTRWPWTWSFAEQRHRAARNSIKSMRRHQNQNTAFRRIHGELGTRILKMENNFVMRFPGAQMTTHILCNANMHASRAVSSPRNMMRFQLSISGNRHEYCIVAKSTPQHSMHLLRNSISNGIRSRMDHYQLGELDNQVCQVSISHSDCTSLSHFNIIEFRDTQSR